MAQDINVSNFIVNKLLQQDYDNIVAPVSTQMYMTTDTKRIYMGTTLVAETTSDGKLHALKGYEDAGELLTDAEGLADVKSYAHSTFDKSKFTVVGSPNITDDGILSVAGGDNNYISTSTLPVTNPFKFEFDFIWGDSTSSGMALFGEGSGTFIRGYRNTNSAYWFLAFNFDNSGTNDYKIVLDSIPFTWNSKQHIVLEYDGNQTYTGKVYQDGVLVGTSTPVTTSQSLRSNVFSTRWTSEVGNNKLDLKTVKFTSNGVPVFLGNQTGIDTVKPDDYTIVGSPIISADGVASGFSSSNYITFPFDYSVSNFELTFEFKIGNSLPTQNNYLLSGAIVWYMFANGGTMELKYRGVTSGNTFMDSSEWRTNSSYKVSIILKNNICTFKLWRIGRTNPIKTFDLDVSNAIETFSIIGIMQLTNCTLDLNKLKLFVDGNLVYQPCLKIPYALSKTGSKIVDSQYRDRVSDMYEQFGYAPYYTLQQDSQQNFTVIGSPTIVNGVVSNFSASNKIHIPDIDVANKDFEVFLGKVTTPSSYTANNTIIGGQIGNTSQNNFTLGWDSTGKIWLSSFSSNFTTTYGTASLTTNTDYYIKGGVKGTTAYVRYSTDGATWTTVTASVTTPYTSIEEAIGTSNSLFASTVEIDLKGIKIYVDDKLVYTPYIESNFTLPQGEVYGMIAKEIEKFGEDNKVDQTYSATSTKAQSGVAVAGAISSSIDQTYNATSTKAQSGVAVAEAIAAIPTVITEDKIHALKGYSENGGLLIDAEGLADVKSYAHSTFDASKFTNVGSPVITDGIAVMSTSGTQNSNYLKASYSLLDLKDKSWNVKVRFYNSSDATTDRYDILRLGITKQSSICYRKADKRLDFYYSTGTSEEFVSDKGKNFTMPNNFNYVDASYAYNAQSGEYTFSYVTDNNTNDSYSVTPTTTNKGLYNINTASASDMITIGQGQSGTQYDSIYPIDLKYFSVIVDGAPVFSGNQTGIDTYTIGGNTITIPYTLSKTGSKIVDSSYRTQVNAVYDAQGYAPYYTLSGTDFTLPMGELYGMIERNSDGSSSMPSDRSINLTLGVSGSTYTAPANGWICLVADAGTDIQMYSSNYVSSIVHGNNTNLAAYLPCTKGDVIEIVYTISQVNSFIFIYAKGSESEA